MRIPGRPLLRLDPAAGSTAAIGAVPAALAAVAGRRRTAISLLALPAGILAFFRDPDRTPDLRQADTPPDPDVVLAPADGKVMYAGPGQVGVAPEGTWQQVSIFLSLFDVHINRSPYAGRVDSVSHKPGSWLAAYKFESATENERSEIVLVHDGDGDGEQRRVVFRQIVGLVARRVVTRVAVGDVLSTGQRMGVMKFGSRMDVFVPPGVEITTRQGDRTVAGETVIARWQPSGVS